ncbi:MAG: amidase [Gammaproteobacteria bacterium]
MPTPSPRFDPKPEQGLRAAGAAACTAKPEMNDMHEWTFRTAGELAAALRAGEVGSRELTAHYIDRIERLDGDINAVVVRRFEAALTEADAADRARSRGDALGPLAGVPVTIKESYDLAGTATTWGLPPFRDNLARADSDAVRRLRGAGAVFLGKTNVPPGLADFQSYNDIYGQTNNPWDPARTPGGSSGGSAAALAAGFTALEAGSDIGGSIRNPAHYCGVYGHKPTWGVVPDRGHALPGMAAPTDIAVCGPLARSAEDLALALDLTAGPDPREARGWRLELPAPRHRRLSDYRVAVWPRADFAPVSEEMAARVVSVAETLAAAGATVSDAARPDIDVAASLETYHALLWGVMGAGVPEDVHAARKRRAAELGDDDDSPGAREIRYAVQDHRAWLRHHHQRYRLRDAWTRFFEDWDILLCPQMSTDAFPHDHGEPMARRIRVDDREIPYFDQIGWAGLVTVAHLPSTVFPTGPSAAGLPIGLQAVGREFDDRLTIDFCRLLAAEIGGFRPPPAYA